MDADDVRTKGKVGDALHGTDSFIARGGLHSACSREIAE